MSDHPLTETAAAELWDAHRSPIAPPFHEQGRDYVRDQTDMLRAAFDAGREHERDAAVPARPDEVTTEAIRREVEYAVRTAAAHGYAKGKWNADRSEPIQALIESAAAALSATPAEPLARTLLGVPEGHGAPRHTGEIQPGDFVLQMDRDGTPTAGIATHQDSHGNWLGENGYIIASVHRRAERPDATTIWPAPTPPAEEVELPAEHPAHLLDVEGVYGAVCAYMALDKHGRWIGVAPDGVVLYRDPSYLTAFTLPDGTRARRDGDHKDGTPRFVKVEADQ